MNPLFFWKISLKNSPPIQKSLNDWKILNREIRKYQKPYIGIKAIDFRFF